MQVNLKMLILKQKIKQLSLLIWSLSLFFVVNGCSHGSEYKSPEKPSLGLSEIKKPPQSSNGEITLVEKSDLNSEHRDVFEQLNIEGERFFVMGPDKAMAIAELSVWADSTYIDAKYNNKLAKAQFDVLWQEFNKSEKSRFDVYQQKQSWWNQNKTEIGFFVGFTLGSIGSILIVHGIDR